jgi:hypothetical protein
MLNCLLSELVRMSPSIALRHSPGRSAAFRCGAFGKTARRVCLTNIHTKGRSLEGERRQTVATTFGVLNTCLHLGFRADLADREEATLP